MTGQMKPILSSYHRELGLLPVFNISPAVIKTLTVIALKEPIRQTELKELRGSNAYEHVQTLLKEGLISRNKDKK